MLNIYFGDMPEAVYNTSVYFRNQYQDSWLTDPLSIEMIRDIDKSEVISAGRIESPVLGGDFARKALWRRKDAAADGKRQKQGLQCLYLRR